MGKKDNTFPEQLLIAKVIGADSDFFQAVEKPSEFDIDPGEKICVARYVLAGEGVAHSYQEYVEGTQGD